MTSTTHRAESTATMLYVASSSGAKEWWLTMSVARGGGRSSGASAARRWRGWRRVVRRGERRGLAWRWRAAVRSCYEAGRDGFWPHRFLTPLGVMNLVVDSSSIEVSRRARRAKTDRLDGEKLRRLLMRHWGGERGVWQVVQVPSREAEDARHASRALTTLQAERTRLAESDPQAAGAARRGAAADGCAAGGAAGGGARLGGEPLLPGVQARVHADVAGAAGGGDGAPVRRAERNGRRCRDGGGDRWSSAWRDCGGRGARVRRCWPMNCSVATAAQAAGSRGIDRAGVGARIGVGRSRGTTGWRAGAARDAPDRGGDRVGVAALSTEECADGLVSPPVRRGRGRDAADRDCGLGPASDHRVVAVYPDRGASRRGAAESLELGTTSWRERRRPLVRIGSRCDPGFRRGSSNGFPCA